MQARPEHQAVREKEAKKTKSTRCSVPKTTSRHPLPLSLPPPLSSTPGVRVLLTPLKSHLRLLSVQHCRLDPAQRCRHPSWPPLACSRRLSRSSCVTFVEAHSRRASVWSTRTFTTLSSCRRQCAQTTGSDARRRSRAGDSSGRVSSRVRVARWTFTLAG